MGDNGRTSKDSSLDNQGDEVDDPNVGRPEACTVAHQVIRHTECDKNVAQRAESIPDL